MNTLNRFTRTALLATMLGLLIASAQAAALALLAS